MQDRFAVRGRWAWSTSFWLGQSVSAGAELLSYCRWCITTRSWGTSVRARTSWDEDASWIGYFDGHLQVFQGGRIQSLRPGATFKPLVGGAVL